MKKPKFLGSSLGLTMIKDNPANPAAGLVARITNTFNSGLMCGDARLTALADTNPEVIASPATVADRSVKNKPLNVVGSLTKAAVASGSQLVAYSGFSAANYLEQPYSSDLDFGTGDFCVIGWVNITSTATQFLFDRGTADAGRLGFYFTSTAFQLICRASGSSEIGSGVAPTIGLHFFALVRVGGVLKFYLNDSERYSVANTANISSASGTLLVGVNVAKGAPLSGSIALLRISATAPSSDQIRHIFETEKKLFEPNAKCTIDGSSTAVTALAHDDAEDALHVGTSWGRSKFRDLVRVESSATSVGSVASIAAGAASHISAGATGARYVQPSINVRDAIKNREEAKRAAGRIPVNLDYDATTGQTSFALPKGFSAHSVFVAGAEKRVGSTKDYVIEFDGFVETVKFAVAPGNGVWVRIKAARSN